MAKAACAAGLASAPWVVGCSSDIFDVTVNLSSSEPQRGLGLVVALLALASFRRRPQGAPRA